MVITQVFARLKHLPTVILLQTWATLIELCQYKVSGALAGFIFGTLKTRCDFSLITNPLSMLL